jgi:hypothetical protein
VKHFGDGGISENDNHLPLKSIEGNREVNEYDSQMNEIEVNRDDFDESIYLADDMSSIASDKSYLVTLHLILMLKDFLPNR